MDIKDVENLANLARIELNQQEKEAILHDMQGILEYVKVIESVPVNDVDMNYDVYNVWREDLPASSGLGDSDFSQDLITSQFPAQKDGFLKVKKIL
jgi:aspartyl-tRNA(Asn)/glutamyl-tRNA(Gln) amidotransferase subunit C